MKKEMISLANRFNKIANPMEDLDVAPETLQSKEIDSTLVMENIKNVQFALDSVYKMYIHGDLDKTALLVNKLLLRCNDLEQAVHKENDESYETLGSSDFIGEPI